VRTPTLFRVICLTAVWLVSTRPARAANYTVLPDGSGDFPTIQEAARVAVDGDVILLADGVFSGPGNRDIDLMGKELTVRSLMDNPDQCTLDCGGSQAEPHLAFDLDGGVTQIRGLTVANAVFEEAAIRVWNANAWIVNCVLRNNVGSWGGAILDYCSSLLVEDCKFVGNHSDSGSGITCFACAPVVRNCTFRDNSSTGDGGAIFFHDDLPLIITGSVFENNRADGEGGAILCWSILRHATINDCVFVGNEAVRGGAICARYGEWVELTSCTFHDNEALSGSGLFCAEWAVGVLEKCIFSRGRGAPAVESDCLNPSFLTCCDIYANAGGDWIGCIADQAEINGNMSVDPQFCLGLNPAEPYTLQSDSPCTAANNPDCGQIGALPMGCETVAVGVSSMSAIKALY
jgi:predicted outer membrane repeat protein